MKLIPASSARWMIAMDSSWSGLPQAPNIMAPRQSGLTLTPVRPNVRSCMGKHATQRGLQAQCRAGASGAWSPARTHASRTRRPRRVASALKSCIPAVSAAAGLSAEIRKRSVRCTSTSVPSCSPGSSHSAPTSTTKASIMGPSIAAGARGAPGPAGRNPLRPQVQGVRSYPAGSRARSARWRGSASVPRSTGPPTVCAVVLMRRRTFPTRHPVTIVAVILLVALPTAVGVSHLAAAQDPGALRSHINRQKGVERQLASAAARLGRLERATSRAVAVMSSRLSQTQAELARWQARLAETQRELRVTRERLVRLRARLAQSRGALATMLRQRYTADQPDVVSVVLDAKGFADVLERIEFLRRVQHSDTMIVDAVRRGRNDARHDELLLAAVEPPQREQTAAVASQRDALARMTAALQARRAALAQARGARLAALSNTIAARPAGAPRAAAPGAPRALGGAQQPIPLAPARSARALAAPGGPGAGRGES